MVRLALRIVRLPLDIVLLTVDFLRLSVWMGKRRMRGFFGGTRSSSSPCSSKGHETIEMDGRAYRLCPFSTKYGNAFIFRILCPWLGRRSSSAPFSRCLCRRRSSFRIMVLHYLLAGLLLAAVWAAVAQFSVRKLVGPVNDPGPAPIRRQSAAATALPEGTRTDTAWQGRVRSRQPGPSLISEARSQLARGNVAAARSLFEGAEADDPKSIEAGLGIGQCCLAAGNLKEAKAVFERIAQQNSACLDAHAGAIEVARREGDAQAWLRHARVIHILTPDDPDAWLMLGRAEEAAGDLASAIKSVKASLVRKPADTNSLLFAAEIEIKRRRADDAEGLLTELLKTAPGMIEARIGLARVCLLRGDRAGGVQRLESLLSEHPENREAQAELAKIGVESDTRK